MTEAMHEQIQMWAACLHALSVPRLPCAVRFQRGYDDGYSFLMCVVIGAERDDKDREVVGLIRYSDGRVAGPEYVRDEMRAEVLAQFD